MWGRREPYIGFWYGNPKEIGHLGEPGVDGNIVLKWILMK
jgi:hypothetical protein